MILKSLFTWFIGFAAIVVFSFQQPETNLYAGSTTCNQEFRMALGSSADVPCDFIKWKLTLTQKTKNGGGFTLNCRYGKSKNNTNDFEEGFVEKLMSGVFVYATGAPSNRNAKVIILSSSQLKQELTILKMDENVLHFTDANLHLLVGNGGYGCALNRINQ